MMQKVIILATNEVAFISEEFGSLSLGDWSCHLENEKGEHIFNDTYGVAFFGQSEITKHIYYIRNEGYVGNALLWWKADRNGYTTDIREAGKYTAQEAMKICTRDEDTAYLVPYIDQLEGKKLIVDSQYIDYSKKESF